MFKQISDVRKTSGTSFFGEVVNTTVNKMVEILGDPDFADNFGDDKVNFEWAREFDGVVFTVYDWKEYRQLGMNETIEWHIGGFSKADTALARQKLSAFLV